MVTSLALAGCGDPVTEPNSVRVALGGESFTRGTNGAAAVPFTVSNRGAATVLLAGTCGDRLLPAVERREGGRWAQYAGGFCQTIYDMSPRPLAAGASRAEVAQIGEAGEFRLVVGTDRGSVTSGAFVVR